MSGDLNEAQKKSADVASDLVKQLLTVATGVLALTVTFAKDLSTAQGSAQLLLVGAWILLGGSVVFGIWAFGGLVASLAEATDVSLAANEPQPPFKLKRNVIGPLRQQGHLFLGGMLAMMIYGGLVLYSRDGTAQHDQQQTIWFTGFPGEASSGFRLRLLGETRPFKKGRADALVDDSALVKNRPTPERLVQEGISCTQLSRFYLAVGGADREPLTASKPLYGENLQLAYHRAAKVALLVQQRAATCSNQAPPLVLAMPRGAQSPVPGEGALVEANDRTVRLYAVGSEQQP